MPSDWPSVGLPIWHPQGGENSRCWLGVIVTPASSSITIQAACDNSFELYVAKNPTMAGSGSDWRLWVNTVVSVTPGVPIAIDFKCTDVGSTFGLCASIRETGSGAILSRSGIDWVGDLITHAMAISGGAGGTSRFKGRVVNK